MAYATGRFLSLVIMCHRARHLTLMGRYSHTFRNERGVTETKDAILNDEDKVWVEVRHMHMKDALDKLIEAFKQYQGSEGGGSGCAPYYYLGSTRDLALTEHVAR
jgi:hypothetical protein